MGKRIPLKERVFKDEGFILKVGGEVGDLCRIMQDQQLQINRLKRRIKKLELETKINLLF